MTSDPVRLTIQYKFSTFLRNDTSESVLISLNLHQPSGKVNVNVPSLDEGQHQGQRLQLSLYTEAISVLAYPLTSSLDVGFV